MPDIFNYTDYRRFLADYYRECKARDPKISHRYFSLRVGYHSSGFFAEVLSGKKNLTGPVLLKLAKALKLGKEEEEYFINLVCFNQARTVDEKNRFYEKLMGVSRVKVEILHPGKFEYFNHWYYAAVRELLSCYRFRGNYRALARKLNPPISQAEARKAIKLLEEFGMIRKGEDGGYRLEAISVSTGDGFTALNVANFQRAFLDLAREGLDRHPREDRDYSTLTLPLGRDDLPLARKAIGKLRTYLLALSEKRPADQVFQFNFQLFPLSRPGSGED